MVASRETCQSHNLQQIASQVAGGRMQVRWNPFSHLSRRESKVSRYVCVHVCLESSEQRMGCSVTAYITERVAYTE